MNRGHPVKATMFLATRARSRLPAVTAAFTVMFRVTGRVADLDETTPDEPQHPALVLILESGEDLARIVIPPSVWPPEKRAILAVDRPVAVTGESNVAIRFSRARVPLRLPCGCSRATASVDCTLPVNAIPNSRRLVPRSRSAALGAWKPRGTTNCPRTECVVARNAELRTKSPRPAANSATPTQRVHHKSRKAN
jgi:hypothetical protein